MKPPVFILGYMACGKTTLGRALARALDREFIDMDFRIEQRYRKTIKELFAERGEAGFRDIESRMLDEISYMEDVVVACGGGMPCFNDNMAKMNERGVTVWLEATPERIVQRLVINRARRPLMADKKPEELLEAVNAGLAGRRQYYSQACIRFNGDELENCHEIDTTVARFLRMYEV